MRIKDGFVRKEMCMVGFVVIMMLLFLLFCISFSNRMHSLDARIDMIDERVRCLEDIVEESSRYRAEVEEYVKPLDVQWGM